MREHVSNDLDVPSLLFVRAHYFLCACRFVSALFSNQINQMIFVWHSDAPSADDSEQRPADPSCSSSDNTPQKLKEPARPQWSIPLIGSNGMSDWRCHGSVTHEIACHLQEIPENGADNAHLDYIHGDFLLSWLGKIVQHGWSAVWSTQAEPQAHVAKLVLTQHVELLGHIVPLTSLDSNIDQVRFGRTLAMQARRGAASQWKGER